jgi:hypothetical protein
LFPGHAPRPAGGGHRPGARILTPRPCSRPLASCSSCRVPTNASAS